MDSEYMVPLKDDPIGAKPKVGRVKKVRSASPTTPTRSTSKIKETRSLSPTSLRSREKSKTTKLSADADATMETTIRSRTRKKRDKPRLRSESPISAARVPLPVTRSTSLQVGNNEEARTRRNGPRPVTRSLSLDAEDDQEAAARRAARRRRRRQSVDNFEMSVESTQSQSRASRRRIGMDASRSASRNASGKGVSSTKGPNDSIPSLMSTSSRSAASLSSNDGQIGDLKGAASIVNMANSRLNKARNGLNVSSQSLSSTRSFDSSSSGSVSSRRAQRLTKKGSSAMHSHAKILDFDKFGIYGRDGEIKSLKQVIDRAFTKDDPKTGVAFVRGQSGSGKSRLCREVLKGYTGRAFVVEGTFHPNYHRDEIRRPYAPFLEAFHSLALQILEQPDREAYRANVRAAFGCEAFRVVSLIRSFEEVIYGNDEDEITDQPRDNKPKDRSSLKQIFRLLRESLRQICSPKRPTIMFLDDLDFAGIEAVELFRYLAQDTKMKSLVLIGTFEDTFKPPEGLEELVRKSDITVTSVILNDLDGDATNTLVSDVLKMEPAATAKFSKLILRKTHGNPLYLRHFLYRLQQMNLLQYTPQSGRWGWITSQIQSNTNANDELTDILKAWMERLPKTAEAVVKTAALLGNEFDIEVLCKVLDIDPNHDMESLCKTDQEWQFKYPLYRSALSEVMGDQKGDDSDDDTPSQSDFTSDVLTVVKTLQQIGLFDIKSHSESLYRFAHHKIHKVALAMAETDDQGKREHAHWQIGRNLQHIMDSTDNDKHSSLFFEVVDHLTMASQSSSLMAEVDERLEVASLALQAGYKLKFASAFVPASDYAKAGLSLLMGVENKWEFFHSTLAKLIHLRAEMAMCCGKTDECLEATDELIEHSRVNEEIVPAYLLRIRALAQVGRYIEAVEDGLKVLNRLGEKKVPNTKRPPALTSIKPTLERSLKREFRKKENHFMELEVIDDEIVKKKMEIMGLTVFYAVRGNATTQRIVPYLFYRMYELTFENGYCYESMIGLAGYGVLLAGLINEYEDGYRFGELSLCFQSRFGKTFLARQTHMFYGFLFHLNNSLSDSLPHLKLGFEAGMTTDETADAVSCLAVWGSHYLNAGLPLNAFVDEMRDSLDLMQDLEQERVWQVSIPYVHLALNLLGKSKEPTTLSNTSEFVHEWEHYMENVQIGDSINALRAIYAVNMETAYWFGDYRRASIFLRKLSDFQIAIGQSLQFSYRRELFFTGLTCVALISRAGSSPSSSREPSNTNSKGFASTSQYLWKASQCLNQLKSFANRGSVDCKDMVAILQAEYNSVSVSVFFTNKKKVAKDYQNAVAEAKHIGSLQNIALAQELAGSYYIRVLDDEKRGARYIRLAHEAYMDWTAVGKAEQLETLYPNFI